MFIVVLNTQKKIISNHIIKNYFVLKDEDFKIVEFYKNQDYTKLLNQTQNIALNFDSHITNLLNDLRMCKKIDIFIIEVTKDIEKIIKIKESYLHLK